MEHITKAATVTATTELGEFVAIAAAYSVDRVGDQIVFGAFEKTIGKWQASGKRVPLHWDHRGEASNVIGSVDPSSMQEVEGVGLKVAGTVDVKDSDTAREAWRSMKNGSMSLSFGYLVPKGMSKRGKDGANELHEIDLFEVSIVPAPANPDTRILSMKSAEADQITAELKAIREEMAGVATAVADMLREYTKKVDEAPRATESRGADPLRDEAQRTARTIAAGGLDQIPPNPQAQEKAKPDTDPERLKAESRSLMLQVLSGSNS